jgi:sugar phosphate isomerase/epimerase
LVENLPRTHSNVLNTVTEIVGFLDRHGLDGLRIVFDQRAALLEGENPADVIAHLERVGHVHIAYPQIGGDAEATTRDLVDGLLDAGYGGGFSVEPHGVPLDAGAAALGHRIATWITDAAAEPAT